MHWHQLGRVQIAPRLVWLSIDCADGIATVCCSPLPEKMAKEVRDGLLVLQVTDARVMLMKHTSAFNL